MAFNAELFSLIQIFLLIVKICWLKSQMQVVALLTQRKKVGIKILAFSPFCIEFACSMGA